MKALTDLALDVARGGGASFADMRIVEERQSRVFAQRRALKGIEARDALGYCVRVLVDGAWGFASHTDLGREAVQATARRALATARASHRAPKPVPARMATEPAHVDARVGPCDEDPFTVPLADQAALLLEACNAAMDAPHIVVAGGALQFVRAHRVIATTDGTYLDLTNTFAHPTFSCTAVVDGESQGRQFQGGARQAGWEYVQEVDLVGHARRWAEEAAMKCRAEPSPIGVMDLVLDPDHLALTMHESVGHPTESDRILGWEANYAGRSFVRPADVGALRYGSPLVNFTVDNNLAGGLGSWYYDDDGVAMQRFAMVRDGVLVNLGTTRETVPILGWERSNGCCRADGFDRFPINRIPNLFLEAGPDDAVTPESLIAGVDRGIYIEGQGSFSIDQMRRNFQFGGDLFWLIEGGKKTRPLKKVTYHAQTTGFWGSCDGVAGPSWWKGHGVMNCGKGEPPQSMRMTHGASHARFRNIQVGDASK
jgi:TldD protein